MRHHLRDGDRILAVLRELGPVGGDGGVDVEFTTVGEHQHRQVGDGLGGGPHVDDGVRFPRPGAFGVGEAPHVDHVLTVDVDHQGCATFGARVQVGRQHVGDRREPVVGHAFECLCAIVVIHRGAHVGLLTRRPECRPVGSVCRVRVPFGGVEDNFRLSPEVPVARRASSPPARTDEQPAVGVEQVASAEAASGGQDGECWRSSSHWSVRTGRWNHRVCEVTAERNTVPLPRWS